MLRLLELAGEEGRRFESQVDGLRVTFTMKGDLTVSFNEPPEDRVEVIASAGVADQGAFILLFSNGGERLQTLEYVPIEGRGPKEWPSPDKLRPLRWES